MAATVCNSFRHAKQHRLNQTNVRMARMLKILKATAICIVAICLTLFVIGRCSRLPSLEGRTTSDGFIRYCRYASRKIDHASDRSASGPFRNLSAAGFARCLCRAGAPGGSRRADAGCPILHLGKRHDGHVVVRGSARCGRSWRARPVASG